MISGFSDVHEFCALLGFYKAQKVILLPMFPNNLLVPTLRVKLPQENSFWTAGIFKMGPICCTNMSVTNYHSKLHKIPEEHKCRTLHTFQCFSLLWRTQCVTGNENDIKRKHVSFQKVKAELFWSPEEEIP
jgi:hypothetical protein